MTAFPPSRFRLLALLMTCACSSIKAGVVGRFVAGTRDAFLRFPRIELPPIGATTGLKFVRWYYGSGSHSFAAHSRQNMR